MTSPSPKELRNCPTRADGTPSLVAHRVTVGSCQKQQRGMYHKCFSCAWLNARVAANGPPQAAASEPETSERKAPATQLH